MGEERVLGRMKRQHGVITRAQALEAGMTRAQIERCLRSGRWVSEAPGRLPTRGRLLVSAVEADGCLLGSRRVGEPPVGGGPARHRGIQARPHRRDRPEGQAPIDCGCTTSPVKPDEAGQADGAAGRALHRPRPDRPGPGRCHSQQTARPCDRRSPARRTPSAGRSLRCSCRSCPARSSRLRRAPRSPRRMSGCRLRPLS